MPTTGRGPTTRALRAAEGDDQLELGWIPLATPATTNVVCCGRRFRRRAAGCTSRAILRGQGHYLWPDLDAATRRRSELVYADAVRDDGLIRTEPERVAPTWRSNGTLDPHVVQIVFFPGIPRRVGPMAPAGVGCGSRSPDPARSSDDERRHRTQALL